MELPTIDKCSLGEERGSLAKTKLPVTNLDVNLLGLKMWCRREISAPALVHPKDVGLISKVVELSWMTMESLKQSGPWNAYNNEGRVRVIVILKK